MLVQGTGDLLAILGLIVFMWVASFIGFILTVRFMRASPEQRGSQGPATGESRVEVPPAAREDVAANDRAAEHSGRI